MHEDKKGLPKSVKVVELFPNTHKRDPLEQDPNLKGEILGDIVEPTCPEGWDSEIFPNLED